MLLAAVVLAAAFGFLEKAQYQPSEQPHNEASASGNSEPYNGWRDTYAQWTMAALAIVAIGVSGWGILMIRETLRATRKANRINRRIGEAQVRAYLSPANAKFRFVEKSCGLTFDLKNAGQSPATRATVRALLVSPDPVDKGPLQFWGPVDYSVGPVMSGNEDSVYIHFDEKLVPSHVLFNLYNAGFMVAFACTIEWWDVFGRRQVLEIRLVEEKWEWEVTGEDVYARVGKMRVSNARHEAE